MALRVDAHHVLAVALGWLASCEPRYLEERTPMVIKTSAVARDRAGQPMLRVVAVDPACPGSRRSYDVPADDPRAKCLRGLAPGKRVDYVFGYYKFPAVTCGETNRRRAERSLGGCDVAGLRDTYEPGACGEADDR